MATTSVTGAGGDELARAKLAANTDEVTIPLNAFYSTGLMKDLLPDAPDATHLGLADAAGSLITGTTTNGGGTAQVNEKMDYYLILPKEYVAESDIVIRLNAKVSAARNAESLLDVVAKRVDAAGLDATDLVSTSAIDMKAVTTLADQDFTISGSETGDELAAGDQLHLVIAFETDDAGATADGYGQIAKVSRLISSR